MALSKLSASAVLAFATSLFAAADNPEQLLRALTDAARKGDQAAFLSNLSNASRRSLTQADAVAEQLYNAQTGFRAALNERFGAGTVLTPVARSDRKIALARLVDLTLVSSHPAPNGFELRVKTSTKGSGDRVLTEENTFTAVREGGQLKLDISKVVDGTSAFVQKQVAALGQLTKQVRDGAFRDRNSAMIALAKAQRTLRGGENR